MKGDADVAAGAADVAAVGAAHLLGGHRLRDHGEHKETWHAVWQGNRLSVVDDGGGTGSGENGGGVYLANRWEMS